LAPWSALGEVLRDGAPLNTLMAAGLQKRTTAELRKAARRSWGLRGVLAPTSRRRRGPVALRPRLSPGVPVSVHRRPQTRVWYGACQDDRERLTAHLGHRTEPVPLKPAAWSLSRRRGHRWSADAVRALLPPRYRMVKYTVTDWGLFVAPWILALSPYPRQVTLSVSLVTLKPVAGELSTCTSCRKLKLRAPTLLVT